MSTDTYRTPAARRSAFPKLPLLDEPSLIKAIENSGIKKQHAERLWRAVIQLNATDVKRDVIGLPNTMYDLLEKNFCTVSSKVLGIVDSEDGSTTKLIIELFDGKKIETMIMRYGCVPLSTIRGTATPARGPNPRAFRSKARATLCVACQVGCQMACSFCATGTMGLRASLTAGEILEQVYHANCLERYKYDNEEGIRNVVFMGMGEPLDNYQEVVTSIWGIVDPRRFGIAPHRVSISTVGVINRIRQLPEDCPEITLALSLHAPNQELRAKLIPSATAWHLDRILEATDFFVEQQKLRSRSSMRRQVLLVEYIMIQGVNILDEHAKQLGELMKPRADSVLVNLIPHNPTETPEGTDYRPPTDEEIDTFANIVRSHGVKVTIRQTLGQDIGGACGQLVQSYGSESETKRDEPKKKLSFDAIEEEVVANLTNHKTMLFGVASIAVAASLFFLFRRKFRR